MPSLASAHGLQQILQELFQAPSAFLDLGIRHACDGSTAKTRRQELNVVILEAVRYMDVQSVVMGVKLAEEEDVQVTPPKVRTNSDIVDIALRDAETLIKSSGAPNAL